jgi:hypothetical protein
MKHSTRVLLWIALTWVMVAIQGWDSEEFTVVVLNLRGGNSVEQL